MTDANTLPATLTAAVASALSDLPQGTVVVLGCSGGRDSVALLHLVAQARPDLRVTVVHVDHGLTNQKDAQAVVSLHAEAHGMAWVSVPVAVHADGHGVEAAARDARYTALFAAADANRAPYVLVAHTADDRAETVWMRIMRGTGPDGLYGFGVADGRIRRPLVYARRQDVHAYVEAQELAVYDDPMNDDRTFLRVAVRHQLAPLLDTLGDDVVAATLRLAELAGEDRRFFAGIVHDTVPVSVLGGVAALAERDVLHRAPLALRRRAVRRMLDAVTTHAGRTPTTPSYQDVARIVQAVAPSRFSVHGDVDVTVDDHYVTVLHAQHAALDEPLGRVVDVPLFGLALTIGVPDGMPVHTPQVVFGDAARFRVRGKHGAGFVLRTTQPGDTVDTRGRQVPVKDLLADVNMPVALRRVWPVLCQNSRVVWVPGFAAADDWLCGDGAHDAVEFAFVKAGGDDE